jgi:dienelactone hydrolase
MKKFLSVFLTIALCLTFVATAATAEDAAYVETVVSLAGGDHEIPATVCMPTAEGTYPAVVMLHGTGSSRDEAGGGYAYAAPVLAEKYGVATIRIDFMGNGDSTADYMGYTFESAVGDAVAAANYMAAQANIDADKIGVMGWSQGGTDALLSCGWHPELFKSIVTWAGAPQMALDGFFGEAQYEEAKANGYFVMNFDWRDPLNVSLQWCEDVMNTDVLKEFGAYTGPVLAIAGTNDTTVDPAWAQKIVEANTNAASKTYYIEGMDHTFNVFSEEDLHSLYDAIDATGAFFAETLK